MTSASSLDKFPYAFAHFRIFHSFANILGKLFPGFYFCLHNIHDKLLNSRIFKIILDSLKTHGFSRVMWEKLCFSCTERLSVFLVKHNESGIPSSHKPAVLTAGIQRRCDAAPSACKPLQNRPGKILRRRA